jgi:mono/diheme cytochrome c family protein
MARAPETPSTLPAQVLGRTLAGIVGFVFYAAAVSILPTEEPRGPLTPTIPREVRTAWRAAGCQTCHSVFGLGGHTGPDLTNIITRTSPGYIRAVIRTGLPGMPAYDLDDQSLDNLTRYLQAVDHAGRYPPPSLDADPLRGPAQ